MTPTVLVPQIQRGAMDCGVVCLTSLFHDRPVMEAAEKVAPRFRTHGLYLSEIQRIAKRIGVVLVKRKASPLPDDGAGIVRVRLTSGDCHFVTLFHGLIANPADGLVWRADVYFANRGRALSLLMVED
jgi:hypothetical protein